MGRTRVHCRHQSPRWWLLERVRKAQAFQGGPQASLLLLLLPPLVLPRSTHTRRACSCRIRPRTTLASSSEWPHSWAGTCTQEQGSPQSTCSEPRHCRSSSESRQPGRPSRPLPREHSRQWSERGMKMDSERERKEWTKTWRVRGGGWTEGVKRDRQKANEEMERESKAPKQEAQSLYPSSRPNSPDFPDILLGHLHVDDDGVDLVLYQLPHTPSTKLQQAVLLLRVGVVKATFYSQARDPSLPAPRLGPHNTAPYRVQLPHPPWQ